MAPIHDDQDIQLLDAVYAAAAREIPLEDALRLFIDIQHDIGIGLIYHDAIVGKVSSAQMIGAHEEITKTGQDILDTFIKSDQTPIKPLFEASIDLIMAGDIVVSDEVMPFNELRFAPFYDAVLAPLQVRHSLGGLIGGDGVRWLSFATARHSDQQSYDINHKHRAVLFQRHMARAIRILELFDAAELSQDVIERSLEKLPVGIMLVNDKRQVLVGNQRARELVSTVGPVSVNAGKLVINSYEHSQDKFRHWWRELVSSALRDGDRFNDLDSAKLWEVQASRIAMKSSLPSSKRTWMITFKERPDKKYLSTDYLTRCYGLTQAEANVCVHLCRTGDAISTAAAMGLSPNTIRTHLKRAFTKTGTRNQVELALKITASR